MNKLMLNSLFALLVIASGANMAHAIGIPNVEDPKGGPAVWTVPVYNNSGSTLDVGDVVVWDIGSSTDDDDNYVTTTTTADTALVAGVVYRNDIAAGDTGTIVVHGVVDVDVSSGANAVGGLLCSGTVAGSAKGCQTDSANFAIITAVTSSSSVKAFVKSRN